MFDSAKIAVKIIEYANSKGISQKYICEQLGRSKSYLLNVKNGQDKLAPDRLEKIAEILKTSPAYLMDETEDPAPIKKESTGYDELSDKKKAFLDWAMSADESTLDILIGIAEKIKDQNKYKQVVYTERFFNQVARKEFHCGLFAFPVVDDDVKDQGQGNPEKTGKQCFFNFHLMGFAVKDKQV